MRSTNKVEDADEAESGGGGELGARLGDKGKLDADLDSKLDSDSSGRFVSVGSNGGMFEGAVGLRRSLAEARRSRREGDRIKLELDGDRGSEASSGVCGCVDSDLWIEIQSASARGKALVGVDPVVTLR